MSQERFKAEILPIRQKLFHIARKILVEEEEAEDATQEVLLKLWRMRDSLKQYDNLPAFASTVTKNYCFDRLKIKNRTELLNETYNTHASTDNPHLSLERKNTEEVLHKIIENLPSLQQLIIKMKDIEEYEVEEIAEITGTKAEAVRVNLSRARKKVREEYIKWTRE
jgi:RNA polymerase sigma-70 factor (ECF subfamily)